MDPKLRRIQKDRIIAGVCAGLAEYLQIDVVFIRLIFILLAVSGGMGVALYIVLLIIIPDDHGESYVESIKNSVSGSDIVQKRERVAKVRDKFSSVSGRNRKSLELLAAIFIALGALLLLHNIFPVIITYDRAWPVLLIILGIIILTGGERKR